MEMFEDCPLPQYISNRTISNVSWTYTLTLMRSRTVNGGWNSHILFLAFKRELPKESVWNLEPLQRSQ